MQWHYTLCNKAPTSNGEEEYDLRYKKLCSGNFTCKSCNKHFKEEQDYHDHHRKCYLCNFRACIIVLRKHEYKHAYCSVDVPLLGNPTPSKSVRCKIYIAGLQNVNKHRNSGHLRSYRTLKKWNLIASRDVRMHQHHCKISSGRNNTAENIISRKQSCEPCSRKGFKSQRSYQAHLKSHVRCEICGLEACPKVLTKHRLTHSEPLEPDAAGSSILSNLPFCEPVAVAIVSKPIPFQLHVQPKEPACLEETLDESNKYDVIMTLYFYPHFIMNRCHIWNYNTIMINTQCLCVMDQHDVMITSQICSHPCSHVGLLLSQLLLIVGHPLRPPLLTLLPQLWHLFIQVTT